MVGLKLSLQFAVNVLSLRLKHLGPSFMNVFWQCVDLRTRTPFFLN